MTSFQPGDATVSVPLRPKVAQGIGVRSVFQDALCAISSISSKEIPWVMLTLAGRLLVARQTLLPEIFVLSELQGTQFRSAKGLRYLELAGVKIAWNLRRYMRSAIELRTSSLGIRIVYLALVIGRVDSNNLDD